MITVSTASTEGYKYLTNKIKYEQMVHEPEEYYIYTTLHTVYPILCERKLEETSLDFELRELMLYDVTELHKSSGITTGIEALLNLLVLMKIFIPIPAEVRNYLLGYPDMINILLPICNKIVENFNTSTQISLEIYKDPEIDDEYLTIYIRQEIYSENILDSIDEISSECENMLVNRSGWLLITTDFKAPKK